MVNGLPKKLKALRQKLGMSQRAVAECLNVSPSIISSYETGERTPSLENLLSLSYVYHCSTDYLLGKNTKPEQLYISAEGLSPKQVRLLAELAESMRK